MFSVHIYLYDLQRWEYRLLAANNDWEAQLMAEAIALCHMADIRFPHKAVFALTAC